MNSGAAKDSMRKYPLYQGVDCSLRQGYVASRENSDYGDEYCAHIVCEEAGLCGPHQGSYVYELPVLDYREVRIVANHPGGSHALLRRDGGAITWGDIEGSLDGREDIRQQLKSDVREIHASRLGFAILKEDGTLISWVRDAALYRRDTDRRIVIDGTKKIAEDLASGVVKIFSGRAGFVALAKNGSWVTWRGDGLGDQGQKISFMKGEEVQDIVINEGAWAALRKDGTVVVWGDETYGGMAKSVQEDLQNVIKIYATRSAFAALKRDGTVVTWGNSLQGGDSSVVSRSLTNVLAVVSTEETFAALKGEGTVVSWGKWTKSYSFKSSVKKLVASRGGGFAALREDNSVVTWGSGIYGGNPGSLVSEIQWGVVDIYANYSGFAILKKDGSVMYWGEFTTDEPPGAVEAFLMARQETDPKRIIAIVSSPFSNAFFAIRRDGSFVSWGRGSYPYHNLFYDVLDDPVWSKVYPDLEYVHYFGILPKTRQ